MTASGTEPPDNGENATPATGAVSSGETRPSRNESIRAANISDQATQEDSLGFTPYVEAIAEFLTNEETKPPLTLSIEGGWGSGKSSFMRQLWEAIKRIEKQKQKPEPKVVWFNAWRHDKVEAMWAAFALEFLRQISTPQTKAEVVSTWRGHLKLMRLRLKWRENWQDLVRIFFLSLFLGSLAVTIPILFIKVGVPGINEFSNQLVCRLSSEAQSKSKEDGKSEDKQSQPKECEKPAPDSGSIIEKIFSLEALLNGLLIAGGLGGSATGAVALLSKLGDIIGNPKNDLKQYLESPDYEKQVAFIEKFHEDFEKIVSAYAGKDSKVYVFVDDLDRCELTRAADLMQGLNLLISNEPHLIFLLGMDREKVAAGIALKQKDVLPYLSSSSVVLNTAAQDSSESTKGLEYGFAFIEKFVQLPFQVPRASEEQYRYFVRTMSTHKPQRLADLVYRYFKEVAKGDSEGIVESTESKEVSTEASIEKEESKLYNLLRKSISNNENQISKEELLDLEYFLQKRSDRSSRKQILALLILSENGAELYSLLWLLGSYINNKLLSLKEQIAEIRKEVLDSFNSASKYVVLTCKAILLDTYQYTVFSWKITWRVGIRPLWINLILVFDKQRGSSKLISYLTQEQVIKPQSKLLNLKSRLGIQSFNGQTAQTSEKSASSSVSQTPQTPRSLRETMKLEVAGDSQTVRDIVLMVAPVLDDNPRRIKQFINLFRLKAFIAHNTGLFDEVKDEVKEAVSPLTLEQLGKFTALCLKYPLLRVDLEKDDRLLANLQRYALGLPYLSPSFSTSDYLIGQQDFTNTVKYWGSEPKLVQLLRAGCKIGEHYNLEKIDIKPLLQVSPRVHPLDRIPLNSEKGVDYRKLRDYLREGRWREAQQETYRVMLQAADRTNQRYLDIDDLENFPCQDLQTIDKLWVAASKGQFGFSVQKRIWQECGSPMKYNEDWEKFGDRVGWREDGEWLDYDNLNPSLSSPRGIFPGGVGGFGFGIVWLYGMGTLLSRKDL